MERLRDCCQWQPLKPREKESFHPGISLQKGRAFVVRYCFNSKSVASIGKILATFQKSVNGWNLTKARTLTLSKLDVREMLP